MTVSITEFITARLDDDEAAAQRAQAVCSPQWAPNGSLLMYLDDSPTPFAECLASVEHYRQDDALDHIARHDPARVLREVEAKRAILELADEATGLDMSVDIDRGIGPRDKAAEPYVGDLIIRQMAQAYSDHPDYNPEWSTE